MRKLPHPVSCQPKIMQQCASKTHINLHNDHFLVVYGENRNHFAKRRVECKKAFAKGQKIVCSERVCGFRQVLGRYRTMKTRDGAVF